MDRRAVVSLGVVAACAAVMMWGAARGRPSIWPADPSREWTEEGAHRWTALAVPTSGSAGFTRVSPDASGVTAINALSDEEAVENRIRLNGSGVAAGDVDGDGRCDLYLCGLGADNALYRNLGGWRFEDVTTAAGVGVPGRFCTGACLADLDGDRDLDLLVTWLGGEGWFENDGKGRFTERTPPAVERGRGSTTSAVADVDGDGDLDVYQCHYRLETLLGSGEQLALPRRDGRFVIPPHLEDRLVVRESGEVAELGEPDVLYLNDGGWSFRAAPPSTFRDEAGEALQAMPRDWGLCATFRDVDSDGDPDLYVCNDFWTPDRLWLNDGAGTFRAAPPLALRNSSWFSMSVDCADVDRDGDVDLFVTDMLSRSHVRKKTQMGDMVPTPLAIEDRPQVMRNTLQLNRGDGTFAEVASFCGVEASEWSWGSAFLDVDLDGWEDILVATGYGRDVQDADTTARIMPSAGRLPPEQWRRLSLLSYPRLETPSVAFRNLGGLRFQEVAREWRLDEVGISQGLTLADLDGDGDLDVITNDFQRPPRLLRNDSSAPRVAVRLRGDGANTAGVGARVTLEGGAVPQSAELTAGGRYLSSSEPCLVFAAPGPGPFALEVRWRDGRRSRVEDVRPDRLYEVAPSRAAPEAQAPPAAPAPLLVDAPLDHRHVETGFDDFARQSLLPNRLSQLGPGVTWFDLEGDGDEDLLVPSGRGGALAALVNDGAGAFTRRDLAPAGRDQTTVLGVVGPGGARSLLVGESSFEDARPDGPAVVSLPAGGGPTARAASGPAAAIGPMALADVDGDGDLDLFVGGRTVPGRYPAPADSVLYRREADGGLVEDAANSRRLAGVGLVSGATWSDLDLDGDPDLVLAIEWGPVRVFENERGALTDRTKERGLDGLRGWWTAVTAGDLDGDGRPELVCTNWGLNSKYHPRPGHPARVYYGDLEGNGEVEVVEAKDDPVCGEVPVRGLSCSSRAMPLVRERMPTYEAFANAKLGEIYGEDRLRRAERLEVEHLEHVVLSRRGDAYVPTPLPPEAQLAPAFGVVVADFDGDGAEDVLLAQNFFATQVETPRNDAGRGLLLRGDGRGGLTPMSAAASGVRVWGDQRGCAVADADADGRLDVAIAQNGAATRLLMNRGARPGLRVRLKGRADEPLGVGAVVRAGAGPSTLGPAREITAGAGYWSQHGAVVVLQAPPGGVVSVRWPWGGVTTAEVPPGAKEIVVERPAGE